MGNPFPTSHNFFFPENVCFLCLFYIFKCTSDLVLMLEANTET